MTKKTTHEPTPTLKNNQGIQLKPKGGARPGAGRKPGKVNFSRRELLEAVKKNGFTAEKAAERLHAWLYDEDVRLQIFAFEQIFGKARQSIVTENEDGEHEPIRFIIEKSK